MTVTLRQMKSMLLGGAASVTAARDELTDIDSRFGDADHGITMEKIMKALGRPWTIRGGRHHPWADERRFHGGDDHQRGECRPLWTTFFDGLAEGAPDRADMSEDEFRAMFRCGYEPL